MFEGHLVAVGAMADEASGDEIGDDRLAPPLLPLVDVGQVHLDDRDRERLERIMDRPRVVRPGGGIDDDRVDGVVRVVAPLDELALVVRLAAQDGELELPRPLVDPALELGDRQPSVQPRVAAAEDVQIDAVEDEHPHAPGRLRLPPGGAGLRRRLTTPAARSVTRGARSYVVYCPSRLALGSLAGRRPRNVRNLTKSTYRVRAARLPRGG